MFDVLLQPDYIGTMMTAFAAPFPIMFVCWITKKVLFD